MAELVGKPKPKETMWDAIARFTPQLDQLQHKGETITSEAPLDLEVASLCPELEQGCHQPDLSHPKVWEQPQG